MESKYETVIGLEVHAQLATRTKIFCGCPTDFGAPANSQTCPVCLGHPGALPVLNQRAVELAVRGSLAVGATVHPRSRFARKNYFYPDLPKGYQISQFDEPLATDGSVQIELETGAKSIALLRLHMEEDAGKLIHDGMPESDRYSYVDLNRAGVPLVEIVSQPELNGPEEAYAFLQRLRSILRYTRVCDGNMEQGSLRCDANVSIRLRGSRELGTRTEVKNLNSFRNVQRALEFEIARQIELVESGGSVVQETILWDADAGRTRSMRSKEEAHDYRYFPEPDLLPVELEPAWVRTIRDSLPELPAQRKQRLAAQYALTPYEAQILTLEAGLAEYYEQVASASGNPKASANFILNDLLREQKVARRSEEQIPLDPRHLAGLIRMVDAGTISNSVARNELLPEMYKRGIPPEELVRGKGLEQVSDEAVLCKLIREIVAAHPEQVAQYQGGKIGVLGYLVGKVMKASGGKANPKLVGTLLKKEIG